MDQIPSDSSGIEIRDTDNAFGRVFQVESEALWTPVMGILKMYSKCRSLQNYVLNTNSNLFAKVDKNTTSKSVKCRPLKL